MAGKPEIPPVVGMTSKHEGGLEAGWSGRGSLHSGRDDTRGGWVERRQVGGEAEENEILVYQLGVNGELGFPPLLLGVMLSPQAKHYTREGMPESDSSPLTRESA
jgi:hypothetical protein